MSAVLLRHLGVVAAIAVAFALTACGGLATRPGSAASAVVPTSDTPPPLPISQSVDISATIITPTHALNPAIEGGAATAPAVLRRLREQRVDDGRCAESMIGRESRALLRRPEALVTKIEHALPLLDYVLSAVEQRNLPGQFALIPWAESGFRADPGNRGTVQGLWQFAESTGRAHGLRIDRHYDGRRSAIDSTRAAVDHLDALQKQFGDWRHALLAYNAGAYRVERALRKQPLSSSGLPTTLAPHSYVYLQKILALACILGDPQAHGLAVETLTFERLREVPRPVGIDSISKLALANASTLAELQRYNAAFRDGHIANDAPQLILLPERAARTAAVAAATLPPAVSPVPADKPFVEPLGANRAPDHIVTRGESLWRIARLYRVRLNDLLRINGLSPRSVIRPGQRLRIAAD